MEVVSNLVAFLRGGTNKLLILEEKLINAVADRLEVENQEILLSQISMINLVQRPQKGRNAFCYYPKRTRPMPLPYTGYEYCLANISYVASKKKRNVKVILHDGVFQSLEGKLPAASEEDIEVIEIKLHPRHKRTNSSAIDKYEHSDSI